MGIEKRHTGPDHTEQFEDVGRKITTSPVEPVVNATFVGCPAIPTVGENDGGSIITRSLKETRVQIPPPESLKQRIQTPEVTFG